MLKDYLEEGNIIKIASGCGTEDAEYIEKLVRLYSLAGVRYFDISARPSSVIAAREGARKAGKLDDIFINVSMGIKGDPHADKAKIHYSMCSSCGACVRACKNEAILGPPLVDIVNSRCIGCGQCAKVCPRNAIEMYSAAKPVRELVEPLKELGVDSIELHMAGDIDEAMEQWRELQDCFPGILSAHINRTMCGDKRLLKALKEICDNREPYTTTIQADGLSMSGDEGPETTLQAVAISQIIDMVKLPAYIIPSGGTNHHTARYLREFNIKYTGIAYGTFARNIVKEYLNTEGFFDNPVLVAEACKIIHKFIFNEGKDERN